MEVKARLQGISHDMMTGNTLLTFAVKNVPTELLDSQNRDLRLKTVIWREKRSLDANAYAWVLMTKLAQKINVSTESIYEQFLQENPILYEDENGHDIRLVPFGKQIKSENHMHWFFVKTVTAYNKKIKLAGEELSYEPVKLDAYARLKGTSQYSTSEMAHFIEQIIYECHLHGIDTITTKQKEQMLRDWGEKIA